VKAQIKEALTLTAVAIVIEFVALLFIFGMRR
jgi:hypothetical protein